MLGHGFSRIESKIQLKCYSMMLFSRRGLDNAGKTTVLKRLMGRDVTDVSPTLCFSIETLQLAG